VDNDSRRGVGVGLEGEVEPGTDKGHRDVGMEACGESVQCNTDEDFDNCIKFSDRNAI